MNHNFHLPKILLALTTIGTFCGIGTCFARDPLPVTVKTYAVHAGGHIVNHYELTNNMIDEEVTDLKIGYSDGVDEGARDGYPQLTAKPVNAYWKDPDHLTPGLNSAPNSWHASVGFQEGYGYFWYEWDLPQGQSNSIQPGQTARFSVAVDDYDPPYLQGYFTVWRIDKATRVPYEQSAKMQLIDKQAPVMTLTATPSVIWPPNNKLVPVTITVNVKDDYDPEPEIQLVSIVANEPLADGDIKDADYESDDRAFTLMATRAGGNKVGRIYTLTYAAIDASGNKSTASVNVTVPHDQGKI